MVKIKRNLAELKLYFPHEKKNLAGAFTASILSLEYTWAPENSFNSKNKYTRSLSHINPLKKLNLSRKTSFSHKEFLTLDGI